MQVHALLVDGFNLIRRIYEARVRSSGSEDMQAIADNAGNSLARALRTHTPTHVCVALDSHDKTWRHLLYSDYKQNRKPPPAELMDNLHLFRETFEALGVPSILLQNYEADDVIATLASKIARTDGKVTILSTDKIFLQLLSDRLVIFDHFKDELLTNRHVVDKFGVEPAQLVDYWSLVGDSTNNIKGVPGIGPQSARRLIAAFGTLAGILTAQTEDVLAERVKIHEREATISRRLVELEASVEVGLNLRSLRYRQDSH